MEKIIKEIEKLRRKYDRAKIDVEQLKELNKQKTEIIKNMETSKFKIRKVLKAESVHFVELEIIAVSNLPDGIDIIVK